MRASIRSAVAGVALVVMLGACGGGDYKGLTKTEFLKQANRTCLHPTKKGEEVRDALKVEQDPQRKAKLYLDEVLPRLGREIDRIEDLKPPKADRGTVKDILELTRDEAETLRKNLEDDPVAALAAGRLFTESADAATKYGLRICAA